MAHIAALPVDFKVSRLHTFLRLVGINFSLNNFDRFLLEIGLQIQMCE